MKSKNIFVVLIVGAGVYFSYRHFYPSKKNKVKFLISKNFSQGTEKILMGFDDGFIDSWYLAAKDNMDQFSFNNAMYKTVGGKKVV